ncbi:DUF4365 domain-containing protein [Carnobacterium divergens]|uniref:DUF4365 domain-containing protein n=1 Tax=Carnobacterium divergens TaxID=2748 RepID=A0AAW8R6C9_CARDV|nr:DUF4365 domain-containing protein [Carnobacterium divergens]MDT1957002.1 DUF4365 domain-containing protein [Carnobacterium divergens]MDT1972972.1 DUF4365 domain-containing protein [Carnobacterium divergens]
MRTVKRSPAQKTGETAESLLESRLSKYGSVNKYQKDFGIDFACSITLDNEHTGEEFLAQCKGTEKISESSGYVTLQLSCATVRLWFKKRYLTFLFYVDMDKEDVYWIDPFPQLYEKLRKISDNQEKISIKIPKDNLLDKKSQILPNSFIDSMHNFDKKLFDGTLVEVNRDLDMFSKKDYFHDGLLIEDNEQTIVIKNQNVKLIGYYADAKSYNSSGSCLVQIIRHVKKAENDLTFSHEQILDLFYFGKGTNIQHYMRRFIKGYLKEYGQYFVDLGNSRIYLYPNEVEELCQVIDIFITKYVSRITQFMKKIGNTGFEPYKKEFTNIKLLQINVDLWHRITNYVSIHQASNGTYEDGYMYTVLGNRNQIGLNDIHGKQVFNITGYFVQSSYNSKEIVVDVVWEYMDSSGYYNISNNPFSVEETYLFFVDKLMRKFLMKSSIVTSKKWIGSIKKEITETMSKEEVEKYYLKTNYKLDINSIKFHRELGNIYYQLIQFLKEKKYYYIDIEILVLHCEYFNKCIQSTLINYSDYTQDWFEREKEDIDTIFEEIRIKESEKLPIEGFLYASIFKFLESIIYEFKDSFNDNNLYFKSLIQDLSNLVVEYNEQQFVKLLLGKKY